MACWPGRPDDPNDVAPHADFITQPMQSNSTGHSTNKLGNTMKYLVATAFVLSSTLSAHAFGIHIGVDLGADGESAVLCVANEVTVLAQSADDCGKIGGMVSHDVSAVTK